MKLQVEIIGENKKKVTILPNQLESICRLCLKKNAKLKIFGETRDGDGKFNEMLFSLGLLEVEENDSFSKVICSRCATLIVQFKYFKEQIDATQLILNIALGKISEPCLDISNIQVKYKIIQKDDMNTNKTETTFNKPELNNDPLELVDNSKTKFKHEDDKIHEENEEADSLDDDLSHEGVLAENYKKDEDKNETVKEIKRESILFNLLSEAKSEFSDKENNACESDLDSSINSDSNIDQTPTVNLHDYLPDNLLCYETLSDDEKSCGNTEEENILILNDNELSDEEHNKEVNDMMQATKENSQDEKKSVLRHRFNKFRSRKKLGYSKIPCSTCGKLIAEARMKEHVVVHTKEKTLICEICGKVFRTQSGFRNHFYTHCEDRSQICHLCGKRFTYGPRLRCHLKRHMKRDGCICHICGRIIQGSANLQRHLNKHRLRAEVNVPKKIKEKRKIKRRVKSKQCNICNKFVRVLSIHMRSHTGEKPYQCKECGKCFTQFGHLSNHKKLHTGEKSYICNYCGKGFTQNGNLQQHIRTHKGDRPHPCNVCNKAFYTNSSLRKHKTIHGNNEEVLR